MAVGLKTWDASGNLVIDTATRMSRVLGMVSVAAGGTGSVTDAGFATGAPYCICLHTDTPVSVPTRAIASPIIAFAGTTMTYDAAFPAGDHILIYGVY